jgi:alkylation response protein AidB-like acyl-CoA dehydrogenase
VPDERAEEASAPSRADERHRLTDRALEPHERVARLHEILAPGRGHGGDRIFHRIAALRNTVRVVAVLVDVRAVVASIERNLGNAKDDPDRGRRLGIMPLVAAGHAAWALSVARSTLDDMITLAKDKVRMAATYATEASREVVQWCHLACGTTAIRECSRLERAFHDMYTGSRHAFVSEKSYTEAAQVLLGLTDKVPGL